MTPEELRLQELERARAEADQQQAAQAQQQASQASYQQMEAHARQIQEDVQRREAELSKVGFPPEPYLPHSYTAPGVQLGDQISAIGDAAGRTVGDIGQSTLQTAQNVAGGIVGGLGTMMSDIGSAVRPIFKTPPMGVAVGYGGYHVQTQGFFSSMAGAMGAGSPPRHLMSQEYRQALASDAGERLGYGATSAMTAAAGFGASLYAMKLPGVGAAGAAVGRAAGGVVGLGKAGAAIGRFGLSWLALPMAAYEAASHITDASVGVRRRAQGFMEASSFRFAGAGSEMADPRMGRGMSRDARREMSEYMRTLDIEDELMGTEDIQNVLQEGTRLGLFEGVGGELDKFKRRFKEVKDNVKEMAKVLNVSLEEGLATMKELYGSGIDPGRARELATFASATGRVAGRTGSEMITLGLQGAEQFRGTGVSMDIGMRGAMMNLTAIRAARDAGLISKEAIEQAGGEESLAMRRTQRQVQFAQSGEGRGFMASFFDQGTGGLNATAFEEAITQGKSITELAQDAARNLNDPAKLIQFESQQERIASEMGKAFGGRGLQFGQWGLAMAEARYLADATGSTTEDAFRATMLRKGISPQELEAIQGEMAGSGSVFGALQKGAESERNRLASEEAERNKPLYEISEKLTDLKNSLLDYVGKPINKLIDKVSEGVEATQDALEGKVRGSVADVPTGMQGVTGTDIKTGPDASAARKAKLFSEQAGAVARNQTVQDALVSSRVLDADQGGGWFGLLDSPGEELQELVEEGAFGTDIQHAGFTDTENRQDLAMVTDRRKVGIDFQGREVPADSAMASRVVTKYKGFTENQLAEIGKRGRLFGMTNQALEQMKEAGNLLTTMKDAEGRDIDIRSQVGLAAAQNQIDPSKGLDANINNLLGEMGLDKKLEDLTFKESASIVYNLRQHPRWQEAFEQAREGLTKLQSAREMGEAVTYKNLGAQYRGLKEKLEDRYDIPLSKSAVSDLSTMMVLREDMAAYMRNAEEGVAEKLLADTGIAGQTGEKLVAGFGKAMAEGTMSRTLGREVSQKVSERIATLSDEQRQALTPEELATIMREASGEQARLLYDRSQKMAGNLIMDEVKNFKGDKDKEKDFYRLIQDIKNIGSEPLSVEDRKKVEAQLKGVREELSGLTLTQMNLAGSGADLSEDQIKQLSALRREEARLEYQLDSREGSDILSDIVLTSRAVTARQSEMAKNLFGRMLEAERLTDTKLTDEMVGQTKTLVGAMIDDPAYWAENLTEEQRGVLRQSQTGRTFLAQGKLIQDFQKTITGMTAQDQEITEETFTQTFGDRGKAMWEKYAEKGDITSVLEGSFNETIAQTVGLNKMGVSGGTSDLNAQSSIELFRVMTAENWTTLQIMQSFHKMIKEGGK